jgi:ankyrin repeat protein
MIAVEQKKTDFVNALVKAGADPNKKDRGGKSALIRAKNNEALLQALKGN